MRLILLARTSTEELQSPTDSLAWQRARAEQLAATVGGTIVDTVHDVGISRSVPWKRRPGASGLLDRVRAGHPEFDGVIVGEISRAFGSPEQAFTVLPLLAHFGVGFFAPELGGRHDPLSESAEILVGAFVGMSRSERQRTRIRVKTSMVEQAKEGRWLGGRPPFGYQIVSTGVAHPNPSKAREGKTLHRLDIDPDTAPVVERIFADYLAGAGFKLIAQRLTDDGVLSPSGHDPARNRHRAASHGAWSAGAIRAILTNPTYTGRRAWGRTFGEDRLLDPEDVANGSKRVGRTSNVESWVWSAEPTHPAIVSPEDFAAVERIRTSTSRRTPAQRPTTNRYLLRGLVWCTTCAAHGRHRRLEGTSVSGRAMYRCRLQGHDYAKHPALADEHPSTATISEARLIRGLDRWLAGLFEPDAIEATITAMTEAVTKPDPESAHRVTEARRTLADAEARIENLRKAIESGADPELVAEWTRTAKQDRDDAKRAVAAAVEADSRRWTREDVAARVGAFADVHARLVKATPAQRQKLYAALELRIDFTPGTRKVSAQVGASRAERGVGGGT